MATLAQLVVKITGDTGQLVGALDQAEKRAGSFAGGVQKSMGGLKTAFGDVAKTAAGFLVGQAVGGAAKIVTGQIGSILSGASDLQESMSKVNVVFGESAGEIQDWSKKSATAFGQSRQQALEAAGTFGNLFTALGLNREEAAKLSPRIVELASDLASFNNLSPDEVLEKLRSGLVGEIEPLRSLGVSFDAEKVKAKALEMGLADAHGEISEGAKVQARYALILDQTKNAQGDFARTSGGLANQQRILSASIKDLKAGIGEALLPVVTALVKVLASKVVPAIAAGSRHFQTFVALIRAAVKGDLATASKLFNELPKPLQTFALFLAKHQGTIKAFLAGVRDLAIGAGRLAVAFAKWTKDSGLLDTALVGVKTIAEGVAKAIKEGAPIVERIVKFFKENKAAAIALGIALGVLLVALLPVPAAILAIVLAVGALKKHWDDIKRKTLEVWRSIPGPVREAIEMIVEIVRVQFALIKERVETAMNLIRDVVKIAMALLRGDWGAAWEGLKDLLGDAFEGIKAELRLQLELVKAVIGEKATAFGLAGIDLGRRAVSGIIQGLKDFPSLIGGVPDLLGAIFGKIWDLAPGWVKSLLGFLGMGPGGSGSHNPTPSDPRINPGPSTGTPTPTPAPSRPPGGFTPRLHTGHMGLPTDQWAFLGKGERVLSAAENRRGALAGGGGGVAHITIINHGEVPEKTTQKMLRDLQRMLREDFGMKSLTGRGLPVSAYSPSR